MKASSLLVAHVVRVVAAVLYPSQRPRHATELLDRLKSCKQLSDFSGGEDWVLASPLKHGRLPYSYTGVWRELVRAAELAKIGHLGTHAFRTPTAPGLTP
jgi:hypothetical protein